MNSYFNEIHNYLCKPISYYAFIPSPNASFKHLNCFLKMAFIYWILAPRSLQRKVNGLWLPHSVTGSSHLTAAADRTRPPSPPHLSPFSILFWPVDNCFVPSSAFWVLSWKCDAGQIWGRLVKSCYAASCGFVSTRRETLFFFCER